MKKIVTKQPNETRQKIVLAAFEEFYKNGFQGGSINHIIKKAGSTKGALFHHFPDKQALGYAIVEEIIHPTLKENWFDRLSGSIDPITDIKALFRRSIKEDVESGRFIQGCPLNNLALEMSQLDEGFRKRIERVYEEWRGCLEAALARGIKAGKVRKNASAQNVATFIVAVQMGLVGTAKNSQSPELLAKAGEAMFGYLDTLIP
jgi:TetR/AcrR family transcriptional regulator, transcriptional repressor for nem operon